MLPTPKHYTSHLNVAEAQATAPIIPVAIDIGFSPQEQVFLKSAIQEWNHALNGQLQLSIYTDRFNMEDSTIAYIYNAKGFMMLKVSSLGTVMYHLDNDTVAITSHIGTAHEIYFLKEKVGLQRMRQVALHEIGHALGAYHTQQGLMKHEYDAISYDCIDRATVAQVAEYQNLDISKMNWCQ